MQQLMSMPFPGNVRELTARLKKFVTSRDPRQLLAEEGIGGMGMPTPLPASRDNGMRGHASSILDPGVTGEPTPPGPVSGADRDFIPLKEATRRAVEETERRLINEALQYTLWNRRKAAKLLRISYSSLLRRIDQYNLGRSDGD